MKSINRREFILLSAGTVGLGALSLKLAGAESNIKDLPMTRQPNIVVFLASDLGYGDLGCYGNSSHRTPNIDRLAAKGIRFTDFHSNGSMCSPSRAALLTGRYQQRVGLEYVLNHHSRDYPAMSKDAYTFGHAFKKNGYATGFFGVHHTGYMPEDSPVKSGFDEFYGLCGGMDHHSHVTRWGRPNLWNGEKPVEEKGYVSDLIAKHAIEFMQTHRDKPFCMHVADFLVHFPFQGPNDEPLFKPGANNDSAENKYGQSADPKKTYREMVEAMDKNVGRILDSIRELGIEDRTIFIFTTDHGGHHLVADNVPCKGAKGSFNEGGQRIPAIASWPGVLKPGKTEDSCLMLMDIFPTILDACGLGKPKEAQFDGASFWPLISKGEPIPERTLFWRMGAQKAVRRGKWKLLVDSNGEKLYDLAADMGETKDRLSEEPAVAEELRMALKKWEEDIPPSPKPLAKVSEEL